ncbi:MAG: ferredoxin, partial [Thermoprotei archaeon]
MASGREMSKITVTFQPYGRRVKVQTGTNLLEATRLAGISIRSICGGKGQCGKCKVIVIKGKVDFRYDPKEGLLTDEELKEGCVLACLSRCLTDCEVFIPPETRIEGQRIQTDALIPEVIPQPAVKKIYMKSKTELERSLVEDLRMTLYSLPTELYSKLEAPVDCCRNGCTLVLLKHRKTKVMDIEKGDTRNRMFGIAVDIGTTKIVVYLVDLITGKILGYSSEYNGQLMYGEDVISRISYAVERENGLVTLQKAVVNTINKLIRRLALKYGVKPLEIYDACVAGNTVMTYLFTGTDPAPLLETDAEVKREPFVLKASSLGLKINPHAQVYCLPCVSRFLGGDAIGDVLLSGMYRSSEISLLIDIGTNVEVILGSEGWFLSTTAAAGPAFEGWGIRFGIRAIEGAIESVRIDPKTLKAKYTVIGNIKPKGICGSGLIDLLSEMFRHGLIDSLGKINRKLKSPYIREGYDGYEYVVVPREESGIGRDIVITEKDIANLIDSKSAACAAIAVLLKKMRLSVYDVTRVYICGAFGSYIDPNSAIAI